MITLKGYNWDYLKYDMVKDYAMIQGYDRVKDLY